MENEKADQKGEMRSMGREGTIIWNRTVQVGLIEKVTSGQRWKRGRRLARQTSGWRVLEHSKGPEASGVEWSEQGAVTEVNLGRSWGGWVVESRTLPFTQGWEPLVGVSRNEAWLKEDYSGFWVVNKLWGTRGTAGRQFGGDHLGEGNAGISTRCVPQRTQPLPLATSHPDLPLDATMQSPSGGNPGVLFGPFLFPPGHEDCTAWPPGSLHVHPSSCWASSYSHPPGPHYSSLVSLLSSSLPSRSQ